MNSSTLLGEALVRVMEQDGAMANDVENRSVAFVGSSDPAGGDGRPRLVLEIRTVERHQFGQAAQVERRPMHRDVVMGKVELTDQQLEELFADVEGNFEPHGAVEPTATKLHLDRFEQVVGFFFLDREVTVATDAERGPAFHDHADEEPIEFGADDLLGRYESTG